MTPELAHDFICRRMRELGFENKYYTRFRHIVLQPSEIRNEKAFHSYFVLTEEPDNVSVKSQSGLFDLGNTNLNELQYEHQGQIKIKNTSDAVVARVRFIQVTPYK